MNTLDTIAELLNGSPDDVLVACDMLEEMDLDLVAARLRSSTTSRYVRNVWSEKFLNLHYWFSPTTIGMDQWNSFLTSIKKRRSANAN